MYLRMALHYQFEYVDEVVAVMRDHTYNIGKNTDIMYGELVKFWNWFFDLPEVPPSIRALRSETLASVHVSKGMQFLGDKDYGKARTCFKNAFVENRSSVLSRGKVLAAVALTRLPKSLSDRVVEAFAARPSQRDAGLK
jgi:hypothetical protein